MPTPPHEDFVAGLSPGDPHLERNVRSAPTPLLAALERARHAESVARQAKDTFAVPLILPSEAPAAVAGVRAADAVLDRAIRAHAEAVLACVEAGVLPTAEAAVADAKRALVLAKEEHARRAASPPRPTLPPKVKP